MISSQATLKPNYSGALGAGLATFSRFPIIAASVYPYSLNGSPIDVGGGDWFVGKAAASIIIKHPVLGQVQVFNTHVSMPSEPTCQAISHFLIAVRSRWRRWA